MGPEVSARAAAARPGGGVGAAQRGAAGDPVPEGTRGGACNERGQGSTPSGAQRSQGSAASDVGPIGDHVYVIEVTA